MIIIKTKTLVINLVRCECCIFPHVRHLSSDIKAQACAYKEIMTDFPVYFFKEAVELGIPDIRFLPRVCQYFVCSIIAGGMAHTQTKIRRNRSCGYQAAL